MTRYFKYIRMFFYWLLNALLLDVLDVLLLDCIIRLFNRLLNGFLSTWPDLHSNAQMKVNI